MLGYKAAYCMLSAMTKTKQSIAIERQKLQALLCQIRQEAGMRQADMAQRLGRSQTYVSQCELGHHRMDLSDIRQFCKVVGIELPDFIERFEVLRKTNSRPSDLENHRWIPKPKRRRR